MAEVLVDHAPSLGRNRHEDRTRVRGNKRGGRGRCACLGTLPALRLELLADGLVDHGPLLHRGGVVDVHRIDLIDRELGARSSPRSPTASARHCRQCRIMFMSPEHLSCKPWSSAGVGPRWPITPKNVPCSGLGDQGHHVVQERPFLLHDLADLGQVLVVHTRDHHRVHLDQDVALGQHLESLLLAFDQDLGRLAPADPFVLPEDPGINLLPDFGIDAVDRDRDMLDVGPGQLVDAVGQGQAVGRHAELDIGRLLREHPERGEGALGVAERVSRTCNSEHRHLRDRRGHRQRLLHGLLGRQQLRDDPGARLVGTVVLAVAVVALDIARRGHGHVHAGEVVVGLLRIAGVIEDA